MSRVFEIERARCLSCGHRFVRAVGLPAPCVRCQAFAYCVIAESSLHADVPAPAQPPPPETGDPWMK